MSQSEQRYDCEETDKAVCHEVVQRARSDLFSKISTSLKFVLPPTQALRHLMELSFGEIRTQYEKHPVFFLRPMGNLPQTVHLGYNLHTPPN